VRLRDVLTPLSIGLFALLIGAALAGVVLIPAGTDLPVHWGISGAADRFLPRDAALFVLPLIALVTVAILAAAPRLVGREQGEAARTAIGVITPAVLALFLAVEVATVLIGMGHDVDMVRLVILGLGILFASAGVVLPGVRPNLVVGVRLPWTLRDPANWQATHRLAGWLFVAGGLAIVLAALLTGSPAVLLGVTAAGVLVPVVVVVLYSWRSARR
jgi:uncharacterized membrane protein